MRARSGSIDQRAAVATVATNRDVTSIATRTLAADANGSVVNSASREAANDPDAANDSATDTDSGPGFDVLADGLE